MYTFNQKVTEKSEEIFNKIQQSLKQKAKSDMSGRKAKNDLNLAIEESKEVVKEKIDEILLKIKNKEYFNDQDIQIKYDERTIRIKSYKDPENCRGPVCPDISQNFALDIATSDIIKEAHSVIERNMKKRKLDVVQETESDNSGCILQLIIISVIICFCTILCWFVINLIISDDDAAAAPGELIDELP